MRGLLRLFLAWTALLFGAAQAAEVRVAVAANFSAPMRRIAADFERDSSHKTVLTFGSTGAFLAQIRNGAPFDLLLSADDQTPARLEQDGLAVAGTRFTYAVGQLVLWSAQPGLVDAQGAVLRSGGDGRIAIADPRLAPYGAAAIETLTSLGLLPALRIQSGSAWVVPARLHAPIRQDAVLLVAGRANPAAAALAAYLRSDKALAVMRSYGYQI